jgi:peroxiredoxin Q/BCP
VIYFYPKDNTPGCTIEASGFAALHGEFIKYDTIIFGVSKDSISSHQRFKEKYTLPFTLLSDPNGAMCTNYGTWKEKSMFGKKYMGIDRQTFLIGKDKKVKYIWHSVQVRTHAKDVLAKIIELN